MATVRNKFHELGNWHNKISLGAIVAREAIECKDISQASKNELDKLFKKIVKTLTQIEQFVVSADETIDSFKPYVYKNLDADAEIPSGKK